MAKTPSKPNRDGKTGQLVGGYRVLGTTRDGVNILKPKSGATHFTPKELRDAIGSVRAGK
jgi:hypothetical protein